jgi:hypothetical protein
MRNRSFLVAGPLGPDGGEVLAEALHFLRGRTGERRRRRKRKRERERNRGLGDHRILLEVRAQNDALKLIE